jgi:hypothetical protein
MQFWPILRLTEGRGIYNDRLKDKISRTSCAILTVAMLEDIYAKRKH